MNAAPIVLTPKIDPVYAARLLGYPSLEQMSAHVGEMFQQLLPEAAQLVQARGVFTGISPSEAAALGLNTTAGRVVIAACTIGAALEAVADKHLETGSILEGMLLDAIGSAAVEGAADALIRCIADHASVPSAALAPRVSPGYADWRLDQQGAVLDKLNATELLGISVTAGHMMRPQKSITFAVAEQLELTADKGTPCHQCHLMVCRYRHHSGVPAGGCFVKLAPNE